MMGSKTFYGKHDKSVLEVLNKDRNAEDSFCDATLQVQGEQFRVHRCLLGGLSDYFKKLFKCEMKEKYNEAINLEKFSADAVKAFIDYFYTAKIVITEENAISLLEAADYFQLEDIKLFCAKVLISSLTVLNCLDLRSTGDVFNCESLHAKSEEVVTTQFKKVIKQPKFLLLTFHDVESIIQRLDQNVVGSKYVYDGILTWVNHDYEKRKQDFVKLFKLVKLHLLPTQYLEEKVVNHELVKSSHECKDHFLSESLHIMKHQNRKEPAVESSSSSESSSEEDSVPIPSKFSSISESKEEDKTDSGVLKPSLPSQTSLPSLFVDLRAKQEEFLEAWKVQGKYENKSKEHKQHGERGRHCAVPHLADDVMMLDPKAPEFTPKKPEDIESKAPLNSFNQKQKSKNDNLPPRSTESFQTTQNLGHTKSRFLKTKIKKY